MWTCSKCEHNNSDNQNQCTICGTNKTNDDVLKTKFSKKKWFQRSWCYVVMFLMAIGIGALVYAAFQKSVATPGPQSTANGNPTAAPSASQYRMTVVDWKDPILEAGIRKALSKTSGEEITTEDLVYITELYIAGDTVSVNNDTFWSFVGSDGNTYSVDGGTTMLPIPKQTISLEDLKYFSGLQTLTLVATSVVNWEALSSCKYLNIIMIDTCGDIDLNWFHDIPSLEVVSVTNCDRFTITEAAKSDEFQSLNSLYLCKCGNLEGSELAEFTQLTALSVWFCNLYTSEALGKLVNLYSIVLQDTGIDNVDFLSNMKNLSFVCISETSVKSVPLLGQKQNLTVLHVPYCGLDDADMCVIAYYPDLTSLDIDGCNVSDLAFLSGLTKMDYLSISGTSVKDISPISKLNGLTELWMCETKITDISVLSNFQNLQTLAIAGLKIKDYSPLANLKLKTLYVDSSQEQKIRQMFPNAEINVL